MKFRGRLTDIESIQCFTKIVGIITKICKTCVLRISNDKLYFIMVDSAGSGGSSVWCEIEQEKFFNEYTMEGLSNDYNEIYLEVEPNHIFRVLKSSQTAKWAKIKLAKKKSPCLTIEVDLPSVNLTSRLVIHDIPVSVVPHRLWSNFQEPEMIYFDVSVVMPTMKNLKNVVDRMKNLSSYLFIAANQNGDMDFRVEADMVSVTTHFHELELTNWNKEDNGDRPTSAQQFPEVKVDIRHFAHFLNGYQVNPSRVICNIVHGRMLQLFLLHDDISLQYFLPALNS